MLRCFCVLATCFCLCIASSVALRGDDSEKTCARCGAPHPTCKVCKPTTETKKVSKTEFDCECEDFCVPGRSRLCGVEKGCDNCGCVTCKRIWEPTCAQVRSKRVLKKETTEVEEKVQKWVVEELCDACAAACQPTVLKSMAATGPGKTLLDAPLSVAQTGLTLSDDPSGPLPQQALVSPRAERRSAGNSWSFGVPMRR